jgi:hypothetical protein
MRKTLILLGASAVLAACGPSNDDAANQAAAAKAAAAAKKKPAYCFFKEPDTKAWAASRDKDGNVVVTGKAYRQDPRYMAVLGPATVTGPSAELSPTVTTNTTGYGAPENWWDVSQTIPNSAAVTSVTVSCGARTLAKIDVPPKS